MVHVSIKDRILVELPLLRISRAEVLFFIVAPLAIALLLGWHFAGFGSQLSQPGSIALWCLAIGAWWLVAELVLRLIAPPFSKFGVPVWASILIAAAVSLATSPGYTGPIMRLVAQLDGVDISTIALPERNFFDPNYLLILAKSGFVGFFYWGGLRIIYDQYQKARSRNAAATPMPVASPSTPSKANPSKEKLAVLARKHGLPDLDSVIAVQAEDHYVRLYARDRSVLVLMPFTEAVHALDDVDGLRTHRSYWVREDAIVDFEERDGKSSVILDGGLVVPVSRRYRELLRHKAPFAIGP